LPEEIIMFSKILVALDQEEACIALFKEAVKLAQVTGAKLMLLSVITPEGKDGLKIPASSGLVPYTPSVSEAIGEGYHKHLQAYEEQGLEQLRSFSEEAASLSLQAEFTQSFGSPGRVICDLARTWEANLIMIDDLIMVGSRQRIGVSEWVMGSVSNYVLSHAPCSALITNRPTSLQAPVETAELAAVEG
jgi:nucleotide-binding universal stress UspA family protein